MATTKSLEWFRENFENIRVDVDRMKYLEELQIAVSALNSQESAQIVPQLQLNVIFDCFNTSDMSQLELAITVAKKLLSVFDPRDVIKLYGVHLGRALEHPDVEAKRLVLNELNRASQYNDLLTVICREVPLLLSVIECVKNDNLSLASTAMQFLNKLGRNELGIEVLLSPPVLGHVKQTASENDTVRFRIYEVIVNISVHSVSGLLASVNSNLLIDLLNELQSNDVLLQLTSLETVTKLALTEHGLQFLKEKQLLNYLDSRLRNADGLNSLLMPGFIKFFGNVAQIKPREIFAEYPNVMNLVFKLHDSDDLVISNVALETIGYIASNPSGKLALNQYDLHMQSVIRVIGRTISLQTTERKVVALNVLANILHLELQGQTEEISKITKKWYSLLSDQPMKIIVSACEKPFKELKLAGLVALHTIAEQAWGQEEINKCAGVIEYLLDRNEEGDMSCKSAKFKIVHTILDSPFSPKIFASDTLSRLQTHIRQGVIYVEARTEIAIEGAT